MKIETRIPLLEEILDEYLPAMGANYAGYKNHCYRMLHFCFYLRAPETEADRAKLVIAAAFHDLGLWTENTVDYLPPSIELAQRYLARENLTQWSEEIVLMIDMHHKLSEYCDTERPLIELFRQADLVDFSLGTVRFGIPRGFVREVRSAFPNAGFHRTLLKLATLWFLRHPLNPAPIMKW